MKTLSSVTLAIILFIFLIGSSNPVSAQGDRAKIQSDFRPTSFFLEVRGNAISYSLNIDHRISRQASVRVGISVVPSIFSTAIVAPIMFNYLAGGDTHFLELGIGAVVGGTVSSTETGSGAFIPTMTIGYRRQPPDGGFLIRAGFTPLIAPSEINFLYPWGGVSVGYTFK
ncbi:hypothetical protein WJR50_26275 [Catalinimonas sp. 4WD22]|uniref:hypothetical protein n=1 Tax=Catalinimonas locisalis TaxID=3133978 RepID=UPI003101B3EC